MEEIKKQEFIRLNFEIESSDEKHASVTSKSDKIKSVISLVGHKVDQNLV